MGPFVVVNLDEAVEALLLLQEVERGGIGGFSFFMMMTGLSTFMPHECPAVRTSSTAATSSTMNRRELQAASARSHRLAVTAEPNLR
jgi:hypothetical protein